MFTLHEAPHDVDCSEDRIARRIDIGLSYSADTEQPSGELFLRLPEYAILIGLDLGDALTLYHALGQAIEQAAPHWKTNGTQPS